MPRLIATTTPRLKVFWFDWVLVFLAISWLLLIWGFGAGPWMVMILGFGIVGWWSVGSFWSQQRKQIFSLQYIDQRWLWWWGVWLSLIVVNIFSSQIPLQSAVMGMWWLVSFLWFWWWSSLTNVILRKWLVTQIFCWGLAILVILNWMVAWFQPLFVIESNLELFPNFILPFFGHHHAAALIVLIWPFLWLGQKWFRLSSTQWRWLQISWMGVLGLAIWLSFSRSAWLALFVQAIMFFWYYRHTIKNNLKIWLLAAGVFSLILISGFLLKDLLQSKRPQELPRPIRSLCYQWWTPNSLCAIAPEPRLEYWQQATTIWQHFPWLGSGMDTFGEVAKRWQTTTVFQSQYPHQMLLQVLAEQGVVGLVVWLVFLSWLLQAMWRQYNQEWQWKIAVLGALVVGSFDFDWQLAGFWLPFLLVVSCLVLPDVRPVKLNRFLSFSMTLALIIVLSWASFSAVTRIAIDQNKIDYWITIWPYNSEWQSLASKKIVDPIIRQNLAKNYYRNSPDIWFSTMTTVPDSQERWLWLEQLWLIDPWRYWDSNPLATATKNRSDEQIQVVLSRLDNWLVVYPNSQVQRYNSAFASELFTLADEKLLQGDWNTAQQALRLAQVFDPWVLHNQLPTLIHSETNPDKAPFLLQIFASLEQNGYGDNLAEYRLWYRRLILAETQRLLQYRQRSLLFTEASNFTMPTQIHSVPSWVEPVKTLAQQTQVLLPDPQSRGTALSEKLAQLVFDTGDDTVSTQTYQVSEFYQLAQAILPWTLDARLWWFERMGLIKPETAEFLQFATDWQQASAEQTGYKPRGWILFYNRVLLLSLRAGNIQAAFTAIRAIQHYGVQAQNLYVF